MDLTTIGPLLIGALGALGFIGQYLRGQTRRQRIENRKLRRLVQEFDLYCYQLEREGWTRMGRRPPARPPILENVHDEPDEDTPQRDPGPQGGARHRHAPG